jgi:hypothetical protein
MNTADANQGDRIGQQKSPNRQLQKRGCFISNYRYFCSGVLHACPDALWRVCGTALAANPTMAAQRTRGATCLHYTMVYAALKRKTEQRPRCRNTVIGKTVAIPLFQCP